MTEIQKIEDYVPDKNSVFIFDTNVLIKIFYPILGNKNSTPYIMLYKDIELVKASVLISSIQISEFVNSCIRFQFNLYKEANPGISDFKKDYRVTEDYRECMNAILEIVEDILSRFICIDDKFSLMDDKNLLCFNFSYDFNDAFIAELSRMYNAYLVTDDGDYANFVNNIRLITNNRNILLFKPKR